MLSEPGQLLLNGLTLTALILSLLSLFFPLFPGLIVMWLALLPYISIQALTGNLHGSSWLLFAIITVLMLGGSVADIFIIDGHLREKQVPGSSVFWSFMAGIIVSLFFTALIGVLASLVGFYMAELSRLKNENKAFDSTKVLLIGWGCSVVLQMSIGVVMILLWGAMVWTMT